MHLLKTMPACFTVYRGLPRTCHGGGDRATSGGLIAQVFGQSPT